MAEYPFSSECLEQEDFELFVDCPDSLRNPQHAAHLAKCDRCGNRVERFKFERWLAQIVNRNPDSSLGDDFDFVDAVCDRIARDVEALNHETRPK